MKPALKPQPALQVSVELAGLQVAAQSILPRLAQLSFQHPQRASYWR
jgi:hypothetical protein